jgi:hypothetical protein
VTSGPGSGSKERITAAAGELLDGGFSTRPPDQAVEEMFAFMAQRLATAKILATLLRSQL